MGRPPLNEEDKRRSEEKHRNRLVKNRTKKISSQFNIARSKAQRHYKFKKERKDNKNLFLRGFDGVFSRTVAYNLLKEKIPDECFSTIIQYALIGAILQTDTMDVSDWIGRKFEDFSDQKSPTFRLVDGKRVDLNDEYQCFYHERPESRTAAHLKKLRVLINMEDNYSSSKIVFENIEDVTIITCEGLCIFIKDKMIIMSFGKNILQILIATIPKNPVMESFNGFMIHSSQYEGGPLFASPIVMLHRENKIIRESLTSEEFNDIVFK